MLAAPAVRNLITRRQSGADVFNHPNRCCSWNADHGSKLQTADCSGFSGSAEVQKRLSLKSLPLRANEMELNHYLEAMTSLKASDLYITVGAPVLLRVDGEMRPQGEKLSQQEVLSLLHEMMDEERKV